MFRIKDFICGVTLFLTPFATAHAITVDVDAQVNGVGVPVDVFLEAGTYSITPIGVADGGAFNSYRMWTSVSGCTAPNDCVRGWYNKDTVTSPNLVTATVGGNPVALEADPAITGNDRYKAGDSLYYEDELLALAGAVPSTFTVSVAGNVGFYLSDSAGDGLADNSGGISLDISLVNPVPVPPAVWLFGSGLLGLVGVARRNKSA